MIFTLILFLLMFSRVSEEIQRVLGFDWLMLFLQWHVHRSTVVIVMRILAVMLSNPSAMTKFREGSAGGGWLAETECVLENRIGVALGEDMRNLNGWILFGQKLCISWSYGDYCLAAIAGATILVPCHVVKSLQLIWRLGTRRWNLRVPDLHMSCRDLT